MSAESEDLLSKLLSRPAKSVQARPTEPNNKKGFEVPINNQDKGDLQFAMRHNKRRIAELYPDMKEHDLDEVELQTAHRIIEQENRVNQSVRPPDKAKIAGVAGGKLASTISGKPKSGNNAFLSRMYQQDQKNSATNAVKTSSSSSSRPNDGWVTSFKPLPSNNIKIIGSSKVNLDNLHANAMLAQQNQQKKQQASANVAAGAVVDPRKKAMLAQVEKLLNRRSTHAEEAEDEWFAQYSQRMHKLSQREYMQNTSDNIKFIEIKAFECRECDHLVLETVNPHCQQQRHHIREVTAVKRFFQCGNCSKRDHTLLSKVKDGAIGVHLPPQRRCVCGANNWYRKGEAPGNSTQVTSITGETLVSSGSEWTSKKDNLAMAVRVSKLGSL